jgi:rubrerythrin
MAKVALEEGFPEIAEWFETMAKAEKNQASRFVRGLESIK